MTPFTSDGTGKGSVFCHTEYVWCHGEKGNYGRGEGLEMRQKSSTIANNLFTRGFFDKTLSDILVRHLYTEKKSIRP